MDAVRTFFDEYRSVFARFERDPLLDRFAFPLHVLSATDQGVLTTVAERDAWATVVDGLLGAYRRLGVVDGFPLALDVTELTPELASARVHWELRRDNGGVVYDFTSIYTVAEVDGARRIAALAHDELPKLMAATATAAGASGT